MWTDQQSAIISAFRQGESFAVRAVAGSGKTTTLVEAFQAAPASALSIAFNKKIADELASRMPPYVVSKTMNSLGHTAWAKHVGKRLTLDTKKLFNLWDGYPDRKQFNKDDTRDILRLVKIARNAGLASGIYNQPEIDREAWLALADEYDVVDAENLLDPAYWLLQACVTASFRGLIDFDDQIYMPVLFKSPFTRYSCVAVDEAQDLSPLQHQMVMRSLATQGQLIVVGDPNQAIYHFRGASSSSFDDLRINADLKLLPMTKSFRCPRSVVTEAQRYVPDIEAAGDFQGEVLPLTGEINPRLRVTVLSRTNAPLIDRAFASLRNGISFNFLGRDFLSGLKALHKKYPSRVALEAWYKAEQLRLKGDGAKARAADRYQSMLTLHASGDPVKTLEALSSAPKENAFTLSTIHKSKGLEWDEVIYNEYEKEWTGVQEDNIKYVGVTRAKRKLHLHAKERK